MRAAARTAVILIGAAFLAAPAGRGLPQALEPTGQPPAETPTASPAPPTVAPPPGTPATVIDNQELVSVLGRSIRGSAGEDMGRIVDVLADRSGQVRAALIDFGGFLGVGSRKVAVDWRALRFPQSGKLENITLGLTRDQIRLAPEYKPADPVVVVGQGGSPSSMAAAPPGSEK